MSSDVLEFTQEVEKVKKENTFHFTLLRMDVGINNFYNLTYHI